MAKLTIELGKVKVTSKAAKKALKKAVKAMVKGGVDKTQAKQLIAVYVPSELELEKSGKVVLADGVLSVTFTGEKEEIVEAIKAAKKAALKAVTPKDEPEADEDEEEEIIDDEDDEDEVIDDEDEDEDDLR